MGMHLYCPRMPLELWALTVLFLNNITYKLLKHFNGFKNQN